MIVNPMSRRTAFELGTFSTLSQANFPSSECAQTRSATRLSVGTGRAPAASVPRVGLRACSTTCPKARALTPSASSRSSTKPPRPVDAAGGTRCAGYGGSVCPGSISRLGRARFARYGPPYRHYVLVEKGFSKLWWTELGWTRRASCPRRATRAGSFAPSAVHPCDGTATKLSPTLTGAFP